MSSENLLETPRIEMVRYGGRTSNHAVAGLWIALPDDVRAISNLQTFMKLMKTEPFKRA